MFAIKLVGIVLIATQVKTTAADSIEIQLGLPLRLAFRFDRLR